MAVCKDCEERRRKLRDAIFRAKLGEAAGHVVAGVKELLLTKETTDDSVEGHRSGPVGEGDEGTIAGRFSRKRARVVKGDDEDDSERGERSGQDG